jgi:hypothetical protein
MRFSTGRIRSFVQWSHMSDRVKNVSDFLCSDHSHLHEYPGQSIITLRNLRIIPNLLTYSMEQSPS